MSLTEEGFKFLLTFSYRMKALCCYKETTAIFRLLRIVRARIHSKEFNFCCICEEHFIALVKRNFGNILHEIFRLL